MFLKLSLLFIAIPTAEVILLLWMGRRVGFFNTFVIIVVTGIVGAALARSQGLSVLTRVRGELQKGAVPGVQIAESVLILASGLMLMTPGFITDITGFLLLVPLVRKPLAGALLRAVGRAVQRKAFVFRHGARGPGAPERDENEVKSTWRVYDK